MDDAGLCRGAHGQVQAREAAEEELKRLEEQNSALEADRRKMEERQRHLAEVDMPARTHSLTHSFIYACR